MNNKKDYVSYSSLKNNSILGFWIYLMSDCIIFSVLFIVHIIMSRHGYNGFLRENKLFSKFVLFLETLILLFCSLSFSLIKYFLKKSYKKCILFFLFITLILGSTFISLEFFEFLNIIEKGFFPNTNGYFSSFYVLLCIHGLHVIFGLLWIIISIFQFFFLKFSNFLYISLICCCLFWHFLDIIWIILIFCVYFN
ncbi:cytochrome c oxidase subunit 3 [Buchnera aphidicola]|uniref:Cytochrome o ubiquinol oxidase subunit III n=1 Tax=Buchnera aphidicola subsp. Cinara cedri (strain Cc) TaxID=372461 RepID=Q057F0_BUCCC|nr:cytochrome c oxidase subunit 3 [Buchnera aphidicola]ABJ90749.1 cytochrome o ubiquinol oxidase subunit III [Buchnera aphidicola BCc]